MFVTFLNNNKINITNSQYRALQKLQAVNFEWGDRLYFATIVHNIAKPCFTPNKSDSFPSKLY